MIILHRDQAKKRNQVEKCYEMKNLLRWLLLERVAIEPSKQHAILREVNIHYDPVAPLTEDEWPS